MKDLATNTRDKPRQIFAQVVSQCDDNVQALFGKNAYTAVPVTSLNGTRMVYSCLNGCGGTEKVPSMNHINHQGCFYHLTQAPWRQIQQLCLVPLYKNDDDFRVFCGMMDGREGTVHENEEGLGIG
jgi:hypothetical protein